MLKIRNLLVNAEEKEMQLTNYLGYDKFIAYI